MACGNSSAEKVSRIPAPGEILNAVSLGIFGVDLEGRVTYLNAAASELIGGGCSQALGRGGPLPGAVPATLCDDGCPMPRALMTGQD
jgi:hypothetical protein